MSDNVVVQMRDGREVYLEDPEWGRDGLTGFDPNTGYVVSVRSSNISVVISDVTPSEYEAYVAGDRDLVTTRRWDDEEGGA